MCNWVLSGLRLLVGLDLQALLGLDLVLNKVVDMISCTNESKPLALSWGWTPRLDSGVRVRKHVVRGESSTKVSKYFTYNRSGQSGTLVGKGSAVIVAVNADHLPRTLTSPLMACRNVLGYFRINLSQLSVIAAAKVSHFEILCRVHSYVLTVGLFRRFYVNSKNKGWMSFSKRPDTVPVCYTKPLDSLKHWNDSFFWVDAFVFPLSVPWHTKKTVKRGPSPTTNEFSAEACDFLATHQAPFHKFRNQMDLFAFIRHADPTKVRIGKRKIKEGQVSLLESTRGHVISLAGENEQGGQHDNVEDAEPHGVNEESGSAVVRDQTEGSGRVAQDEKELFERSTLNVEVGATAASIVPFVTSFVTLTPEREGSRHTDSISGPNLGTRHPAERFVISLNSSHHSSTNAEDAEVTSIVRSSVPPPPVLTAAVATTAIVGATFALVYESGIGPVHSSIFRDLASPNAAEADVAGPSQPAGAEVSVDTFYISQEMDSETLQQTYVPKWNVMNDSARDDSEDKDVEIANLKAQLSLKEAEAAEAIRLRGQVAAVEVMEGTRVNEMYGLKAWNRVLEGEKSTLEGHVVTLESAAFAKNAGCASLSA
ncbi:hypothetical protein Tco_1245197 [Tanacetum coccineum]